MKTIKNILKELRQKWYQLAKKEMLDGRTFVDEFGFTGFVESAICQAIRDYEEAVSGKDMDDEGSRYCLHKRENKIKRFWGDLKKCLK